MPIVSSRSSFACCAAILHIHTAPGVEMMPLLSSLLLLSQCHVICCDESLQVAQLSCLHYNNCHFLAHELVTLPFMIRPQLATVLGNNWQFLEVAGDLRCAGQTCLDRQVHICVLPVLICPSPDLCFAFLTRTDRQLSGDEW